MLSVKMLDSRGKTLERAEVFSIYPTDMNHVPFNRNVSFRSMGEISLDCSQYPVMLNALVSIPGYGRTWVLADNCGEGYADGAQIDLVREGAVSRAWLVERELKKGGFIPSAKPPSLLNDAKTLIKLAETATAPMCHEYNMMALGAGLWAGEYLVIERAKAKIAGFAARKDFLFGCGGFSYPFADLPGAKEIYDSVFNYSTQPFYLGMVEREQGKPDYAQNDKLWEEFNKAGIKTKGHPLWWGFKDAGQPKWMVGAGYDEVKAAIEYVCRTRVPRYKGRVDMFDVINEAHDWANA